MVGEVDAGRVTAISSGPERLTDRPGKPAGPRVQRQAAVAPKGPVAAVSAAVLLAAFGLLLAPRRRGTS